MKDEIEERIKKIIVNTIYVSNHEVIPDASFEDDLGADSLDAIEMVMALEEEFKIEITDEDANKMKLVQDVIDYIKKRDASK